MKLSLLVQLLIQTTFLQEVQCYNQMLDLAPEVLKPTIMPIGTLGTGKSSFLNTCLGKDTFETSEEPEGCTHDFTLLDLEFASVVDTPGLNDPRMPIGVWLDAAKQAGGTSISLCLMIIQQKVRPDTLDKSNILVMMETLKEIRPDNFAVVFTHCDENRDYTKEKGLKYFNSLLASMKTDDYDIPIELTTDRIFLYSGNETSQHVAVEWIKSLVPPVNCEINAEADLQKIIMHGGGDETVKKYMEQQSKETEEFKEKVKELEDQVSTLTTQNQQQTQKIEDLENRPPQIIHKTTHVHHYHSCFAKGTKLQKVVGTKIVETNIEDIAENDQVLAQHEDGSIIPERIAVKYTHIIQSNIKRITLSNGASISVTDNHGMLVYSDPDDVRSGTNRSQLVYARDLRVGMKFRHVHRSDPKALQSKDFIELLEIQSIEEGTTDAVYNVASYNFNVMANDMIVSSHGEITKDVPEIVYSFGKFIFNSLGFGASRAYYKAAETVFYMI